MQLDIVLRDSTIESENILRVNVNMTQEALSKLTNGTILCLCRQREKLIGIKDNDIAEADQSLLITTD